MGQYEVKHPADKECKNCAYFDLDILEDSFGPVIEVYCEKGQYGHVGYYSEACKEYREHKEV